MFFCFFLGGVGVGVGGRIQGDLNRVGRTR